MKNAAAAGLALLFLSAPGVFAQSLTPDQLQLPSDEFPAVPDIDRQVGAQGVDVVSGVFNTQSPTIAIGDPGAGGLSYSLLYDGVGMRHSVTGGIAQTGSSSFVVSLMGSAEEFSFVGGAYAPADPSGSTLTYASGLYTYQTGDGSIVEFRTVPSGIGAVYGYDVAYVERFVAPNGQELSYTYTPGLTRIEYYQTPGGELCIADEGDGGNCQLADQFEAFFRLQSVSSNQGYLLQFEYELDTFAASYDDATARLAVDQWLQLNKVQAINLTEVWCAPTANQCAVGSQWPHMEFDWVQNAQLTPEELTIRDALDNETVWTFDVQGQLTEIDWLTPSGVSRQASKTINYDAEGRVSSISQGGLSWTTTRTETSRVPSINPSAAAISTLEVVNAAPDGTSTTSYVDRTIARVYEAVNAAGETTSIQYDTDRRPLRVTYPEGNAVAYQYDARGNVTQITQIAKPGSGLADLVTSIAYPAACTNPVTCNQPTSVTAPDGGVTSYAYDPAHGGVTQVTAPAVGGVSPVSVIEYAPRTARYYTAAGQLANASTSITLPVRSRACMTGGQCASGLNERVTEMVYGVSGQANNLQVSDLFLKTGDGSESLHTQISYNALGDVISTDGPLPGSYDTGFYQYDALRRQTHMAGPDPDGTGPLPRQAAYVVYDDAGRVEERHSGTVMGADTPNWAFTTVTSQAMDYDDLGRPISARNLTAAGVVEGMLQYAYNSNGQLVCTAQRLNPSAFGAPPQSACTLGQGGVFGTDRIQRVSYDAAGRVNALTDALSEAVVSYAYTANGLQQSLTDGNGNTTLYSYDGFDRQSRIDYAQGEIVSEHETFSYDAAGRLSARTNRAEQSFSYGYDALGRVVQVNAPIASENVTYTYNVFNQITSVTSGGETLTNAYNALGWLMSQTGPDGAVSYQYDAAGRRERLTWPGSDNFYVTYTYDHASRLEEIREMGGTSGLAVLAHYDYDDQGRLESILRGNGVRTGFNYDAASRLEELATELEGSTPSEIRTLGFDYNPAGQITERTDTGGSFAFAGHTDQTSIYDHNALNQIIDITETGAVTRTLTPQWTAGNLTFDGERNFGYDPFNRLSSVTGGGQSDVDLGYDPLGRLAELDVTGGLVTRFQYDGAAMIAETDSAGDVMRRYVHGPGLDAPLVRYDYTSAGALEGRRWLLADERGSIYAHADEAGAIIQINTYDEYGRPGNSNQGRFGYTGQIWLAEAGLYHYKARAYHAELGVFMQSDPIGHSGGINLYAYVGGDPVNFTDPWGLFGNPVNVPNQKCPSGTRPDSSGGCEAEDRIVVIGRRFESGGWGGGWNFGGSGGVYRQPKSQGKDGECVAPSAGDTEGESTRMGNRFPSPFENGAPNADFDNRIMDLLSSTEANRISRRSNHFGQEVGFVVRNFASYSEVSPWVWGDGRSIMLPSGSRVAVAVHFHPNDGRGGSTPSTQDRRMSFSNPEVVVLPDGKVQLLINGGERNIGNVEIGGSSCQ